jgi:hypothetical protein
MKEFDALLYELGIIVEKNLYCEDEKLFIKNKLKYDVVNLMEKYDKVFMNKLYKELEYSE